MNIEEQTFNDFEIDPRLLDVLAADDIVTPTPIQAKTIPATLAGGDVIAIAQTGTGKTLAYMLPALTRLAQQKKRRNRMLVLLPTRELAVQVHGVAELYAKAVGCDAVCVYGGVGYGDQTNALRRGRTVVVATPGRLLDHMGRGNVRFDDLDILVLDEADRMLDMGFLPDIRRILRNLPAQRQTIMCSATFPAPIARLATDMLHEPETISAGGAGKPVESVRQMLYTVNKPAKLRLLLTILSDEDIDGALIFCRTKDGTEQLAKALRNQGVKVQAIHGDRSQQQRQRAIDALRSGKLKYLVATDVAARGLDIEGISHVINYDIPENPEDYIHRIGRTARAHAEGDAITFVSPDEHGPLEAVERALGKNLPRAQWEGAVPVISLFQPHTKPQPRMRRRGGGRLLRRR